MSTKRTPRRKPGRTQARRTRLLAAGLALLASAFASRAAQLQIVQGQQWKDKAWDQTTERVQVPAVRGGIYDRAGRPLALSQPAYRAFFAPREVRDRTRAVATISRVLGIAARLRASLLEAPGGWLSLGTVSARERELLTDALPEGVHFEPITRRVYPSGSLARSLLGSVSPDGEGRSGLELVLDSLLRGEPGEARARVDPRGTVYRIPQSPSSPPRPGRDVHLTIDSELQEIAETALERALDETGAAGGDLLMADPRTGELLAVASRREVSRGGIPAFSDPYEPGSTLKPFLLATLLQEGAASLSDRLYAEGGEYRTDHRTIRDVHGHDTLTVAEVIRFSSNIGAAKLAGRLDPGMQYSYLRDFGFGTPTGLGFPGESGGLLRRPERWSALSQASLAIGYEIMVTSVQLVAAYAALANGGVLLRPGLVLEVRDSNGGETWRREDEPIRRVIRSEVASQITGVLSSVVEEGGTGARASLATLAVAGKTGTARIATAGGYEERRYAASFVGYTPADRARLVILAKLEAPKGPYYGGGTAAPVSRTVVQAILASRDAGLLESDLPSASDDALDWSPPNSARSLPTQTALEQTPYRLAANEVGAARLDDPPTDLVVPDVSGLNVRRAAARLHQLGLLVELGCTGHVRSQVPRAGSRAVPGATVLLR